MKKMDCIKARYLEQRLGIPPSTSNSSVFQMCDEATIGRTVDRWKLNAAAAQRAAITQRQCEGGHNAANNLITFCFDEWKTKLREILKSANGLHHRICRNYHSPQNGCVCKLCRNIFILLSKCSIILSVQS